MNTEEFVIRALHFAVRHWEVVVTYTGIATFVSVMLQYFKRKYKLDKKTLRLIKLIKLDGPRLVATLYTVGVALGTAYSFIIDPAAAHYIPDRFAFILTFGFAIHRFLVSPAGRRLQKSMKPYWQAVETLKKQQDARSALTPANIVQPTLSGSALGSAAPFNPANQQNQG